MLLKPMRDTLMFMGLLAFFIEQRLISLLYMVKTRAAPKPSQLIELEPGTDKKAGTVWELNPHLRATKTFR
jgi:hypothetical protein